MIIFWSAFLLIMDFIPLQMGLRFPENPYWALFLLCVIVVITILALIEYRKDKRKK